MSILGAPDSVDLSEDDINKDKYAESQEQRPLTPAEQRRVQQVADRVREGPSSQGRPLTPAELSRVQQIAARVWAAEQRAAEHRGTPT